ncbi:MAG TPA: hypothetical protein VLM90_09520 [Candidatus Deferrimicrobium sp.]|nr:hypothetical protein [Candidatus Deferrimicrobium sp.]
MFAANSHGKFCLSIANGALKLGQEIVLIWVPVEGERHEPEIRRGKIAAKLAAPCDQGNQLVGESSYQLEAGKLDIGRIYVALAGRAIGLRVAGAEVKTRFANRDLVFRSCTSTEGFHFSIWSGTKLKEQEIWRRYFSLGYDVEPTCAERDFEEIKP